tara:strand:+ start:3151 stop:3417 length:267 start_codon:yes stop_codon:yes gene_type:complete
MNPFEETRKGNVIQRTFSSKTPEMDLIWHRDEKDRLVTVDNTSGWQFQFDNEIPFELTKGLNFFIVKERVHRVIKGNSDLILTITELG